MSEMKPIDVTVKIKSIALVDFHVENIGKQEGEKLNNKKFAFQFTLNIKVDSSKKEILLDCSTKIFSDDSKTLYLAEIITKGIFDLLNFDEIVTEHKGVPQPIIGMFMSILLSTMRGMILVKSMGTIVENAILPIININTLFPQIVSQNIQENNKKTE